MSLLRFPGRRESEPRAVPTQSVRRSILRNGAALIVGGLVGGIGMRTYREATRPTSQEAGVRVAFTRDVDTESELSLTDVLKASRRVNHLGEFLQTYMKHPDVRVNTVGPWELDEEELLKLLVKANSRGREATWEFADEASEIFILTARNRYEPDGRLSLRYAYLGVNASRIEPFRDLLDGNEIRRELLDEALRRIVRIPDYVSVGPYVTRYTDGREFPARRGRGIDPTTGAESLFVIDTRGNATVLITETFYTPV